MVRVSLFVLLSLMVLVMRRRIASSSSRLLGEGGARLGTRTPGEPGSWKKYLLSWFHLRGALGVVVGLLRKSRGMDVAEMTADGGEDRMRLNLRKSN